MKKGLNVVLMSLVMLMCFSSCYINKDVEANQVGIQLQRNAIINVVGAGVYSDGAWFSDLKVMDINTQTFSVEDPEVLTKDNQAVGVKITIQARRMSDSPSVKNIVQNWSSLMSNDIMVQTISATAREGIKVGTRNFTTTQLLDDRNGLATAISDRLKEDTAKYSVEIINVTVENIAFDPAYTAVLNEKAILRVETEKELQRQELIKQQAANDQLQAQQTTIVLEEQLLQAAAQTELDVAVAARQGQVVAEANKVYQLNPQAYQLEVLSRMKEIFGDKQIFWIPEGTDLNQFIGSLTGGTLIPVE
jgi:regulator of protease activity HflC (stomatin/prohibitin superfamily)